MASSLQFFLTRPATVHMSTSRVRHGANVPLIPVDQLPEWLHIADVPRVLSDQHAAGLTNVGMVCQPPETLEVFVVQDRLPAQEEDQHAERTAPGHVRAAAAAKTVEHAQQQKFGRRPGDFIKAQALGAVGRGHGGSGIETERPALPEQRSLASDLSRALDGDLAAAERAAQPDARAVQQPPENALDDSQRLQGGSDGGAQSDRHSPSRSGSVAADRQPVDLQPPVAARRGLAGSMHAPRVAAEHKTTTTPPTPPTPPSRLPLSRAPGAPPQQQEQPSTAEAWDPVWARPALWRAGHGRRVLYCRHWCTQGICKWGKNCRYHHVMPATLDGLAEVGLREFPEWWTAAMAMAVRGGPGMEQQQQQQPHDDDDGQARRRQPAAAAADAKAPSRAAGGPPDQEEPAVVLRGAAAAPFAYGYPASLPATRTRRP